MPKAAFFDAIRASLFGGTLSQGQVEGIDALLAEAEISQTTPAQTAYILATAYHETGRSMTPVMENMHYSAKRIRAVWPARFASVAHAEPFAGNPEALANEVYGGRMGNTEPGDGFLGRGRGHVQTTGRSNYRRQGRKLGQPLERAPDLALDPEISAKILFGGMLDGDFTGRRLDEFVDGDKGDFLNARRVVNGTDRSDLIARYAVKWLTALALLNPSA
jgi:putative chitinase